MATVIDIEPVLANRKLRQVNHSDIRRIAALLTGTLRAQYQPQCFDRANENPNFQ